MTTTVAELWALYVRCRSYIKGMSPVPYRKSVAEHLRTARRVGRSSASVGMIPMMTKEPLPLIWNQQYQ